MHRSPFYLKVFRVTRLVMDGHIEGEAEAEIETETKSESTAEAKNKIETITAVSRHEHSASPHMPLTSVGKQNCITAVV